MSMGEGDTIVLPGSYGCVLRLLLSRARLNAHIITHEQKYRVRSQKSLDIFKHKAKTKTFFFFSDTLQNREARFRKS